MRAIRVCVCLCFFLLPFLGIRHWEDAQNLSYSTRPRMLNDDRDMWWMLSNEFYIYRRMPPLHNISNGFANVPNLFGVHGFVLHLNLWHVSRRLRRRHRCSRNNEYIYIYVLRVIWFSTKVLCNNFLWGRFIACIVFRCLDIHSAPSSRISKANDTEDETLARHHDIWHIKHQSTERVCVFMLWRLCLYRIHATAYTHKQSIQQSLPINSLFMVF